VIGVAPLTDALIQVKLEVDYDRLKMLYIRYDELRKKHLKALAHYWVKSLHISLMKAIKKH
jgi:hypothetical protein